jgi:hypothetical protein
MTATIKNCIQCGKEFESINRRLLCSDACRGARQRGACRKWQQSNKEKVAEHQAEYKKNNREKYLKHQRQYDAKRRGENEKI